MHKQRFKKLCMLLVIGSILFVTGQNALADTAGWEAVDVYHGYLPDLSKCVDEGEKFEDAIYDYSTSWTIDFDWSSDAVYERAFKAS